MEALIVLCDALAERIASGELTATGDPAKEEVVDVLEALAGRQYLDTLATIGTHNQWLRALSTGLQVLESIGFYCTLGNAPLHLG